MPDILDVFIPLFNFINHLLSVEFQLGGYNLTFGKVVIFSALLSIFIGIFYLLTD